MLDMLPAGKITRLFGPDGTVNVRLYDLFPEEPNYEEPLYVRIDTLAVPLFIERFERRGRDGALIRFADIDNETRATELLGHELYLHREDETEEEDGELYYEDLVGFRATLADGITGVIEEYLDHDMNPLLQIRVETIGNPLEGQNDAQAKTPGNSSREVLIPASDDFIAELDEEQHTVVFDLPEGLLELYLEE